MPNRQVITVPLRPLSGERFQPTGFPDIGAATFRRPVDDGWQECLLVESGQSMANHLEATAWDRGEGKPVEAFEGLPYVRVVDPDGNYVTSSRTEAHRLSSAFIKDAFLDGVGMKEVIRDRLALQDDTPLSPRHIARAIFAMDPMCLVHGVFFAENAKIWPGQPKVQRALTAFVEAYDTQPVISGGVKRDDVRHSSGEVGGAREGYGHVPFHRTEWVAREINAYFSLDLDQLESYGLGPDASALLAAAARWEVRSLLDSGFRPRTACDLEVLAPPPLPGLDELSTEVRKLVARCGDLLGDGGPLTVVWDRKKVKAKAPAEAGSVG